ncbi:twin-arginine translocation pathway signal protein [Cypionkella aquatica]|uniref:Twin-arginine translocation pathway signal protein n=1 Tax=Cypionkella aquatica TaxID=1756042 RepID=A0AA37TZ92_9RHOB|nr:intradiol ring-cleavage dioxygenase [Cypionkella aquatica]GLS88103.1 twin-arginine translocation pathway signal protein [Cypionkella aquatica]
MRPLSTLDRRTLLKALSLAPIAATVPALLQARVAQSGLISTDVCLLQAEVTEGPFYIEPPLLRADITEGKSGLPMQLRLQVVTADCTPIAGARVDVWHCDALGVYSGVKNLGGGADTEGQTFLRGTQLTDFAGVVQFETIFPGWYPGRTTHLHYKVFLDVKTVLTSQIFFDETLNDEIYAEHPAYARPTARSVKNVDDGIAADAGQGAYARVRMTEPDGAMEAALVVGVTPEGESSGVLDWLWKKA